MDKTATHLVVNDLRISEDKILVGATDNERWKWEVEEDGQSGADAKTIVYVVLRKIGQTNNGKNAFLEEAGFHCHPGDPVRTVAMTHLIELFEVAWCIAKEELAPQAARQKYFGTIIQKDTQKSGQ